MGTAQVKKPMGQDYDSLVSEGSRREGGKKKKDKCDAVTTFQKQFVQWPTPTQTHSPQVLLLSVMLYGMDCSFGWFAPAVQTFSFHLLAKPQPVCWQARTGGKKETLTLCKRQSIGVCYQLCFSHKQKILHHADCTVKTVKSIPARPCVLSILLTFHSSP